jgi:hypothetical protein
MPTAAYDTLISALNNDAPGNLADLLDVLAGEAQPIILSYSACDDFDKDALRARLKHLCENANAAEVHSFLKLIPRLDEPTPPMFEPFLTQHPELTPFVRKATRNFRRKEREILRHVTGVTISGSQLKAGGHRLSAIEKLVDNAVKTLPKEQLKNLRAEMQRHDARKKRAEIRRMYNGMGLNLSGDRWHKFYLLHQTLWRIETKTNGVQCFRIPRRYFNGQGWDNTVMSARYGISPVGGKSLFPKKWTNKKILQAIHYVLKHFEAVVFRRGVSHNGEPKFFLRARVNMVDIEVGLEGSAIRTAFPSWRQYRPETIRRAYEEWFMARGRLWDAAEADILLKVPFPSGFVTGYLGKCPPGICVSEWPEVALWLNPKHAEDAPPQALTFQLLIFEWLQRSRVVQELEGVTGPVH